MIDIQQIRKEQEEAALKRLLDEGKEKDKQIKFLGNVIIGLMFVILCLVASASR